MPPDMRPVVVTGAKGFIGSNLCVRLRESGRQVIEVVRETPWKDVRAALAQCDAVFHLAGANRPDDPAQFGRDNFEFAARIGDAVAELDDPPFIVFASSAKAKDATPYGVSKRHAEEALFALGERVRVSVWRLPNVFGKWARPAYNCAVVTFCHEIARGLPIRIDDPNAPLDLVHIDDLLDDWLALLDAPPAASGYAAPRTVWHSTVGDVAAAIEAIAEDRHHGRVGAVASGLSRTLYATFMAYLPEASFQSQLTPHRDERGSFAEVLKTEGSGQVSYLTARPGITRGGHYHHAKVEKFVVLQGTARFRFRQVLSGETHEVIAHGGEPTMVETIPGWTHDITNIGEDELIALVWASEVFDPARPDTVAMPV
jgi:UDP-2-acetamido-2,6-beta-L-arabino-hexul-4-ose reductase